MTVFFATGDLGSIDKDGFIYLDGRKGDAFKLSTGRWIGPLAIEKALKRLDAIDQVVVMGSGQARPFAIATPANKGMSGLTIEIDSSDSFSNLLNKALMDFPHYKIPKTIYFLNRHFSIKEGELTANFKIRRHQIEKNWQHLNKVT